MVRVEKGKLAGDAIFVPADNLFSLVLKGEGQSQLRADAITVRTHVSNHAKGSAITNTVEDAIDDFGLRIHSLGMDCSSSPMMARTRLPRAMDSSSMNRNCGVYFRTMDLATRP